MTHKILRGSINSNKVIWEVGNKSHSEDNRNIKGTGICNY